MNLYHILWGGEPVRDGVLYTLRELSTRHPDLYQRHIAKYHDRSHILEARIPHLNCGWNDMVFLCPVHPNKVCRALAQYHRRFVPAIPFYTVPVADLDPLNTVIWLFRRRTYYPSEVVSFDHVLLGQMQEVPNTTQEYFTEQEAKKEPAFMFFHIPHVLYKGAIDVRRCPLHATSPYEPTA